MSSQDGSVVDTNIISYVCKKHSIGERYAPYLSDKIWYISFITLAELQFGAKKDKWGIKKLKKLEERLAQTRMLPFHDKIIAEYVRIRVHLESIGRPLQFEDLWIAASACAYDLPLVSHNRKDFQNIPGLKLICFE
ncbi:MAG TPA: PIN domain-containing protein [Planctomycetota bacterium]|nr:PIN domain-containing protein [Planctomycetota bacterium]